MIIAFAAKIFLPCLKQILFETDHVIRIRRWQRRTADTKRWSDRLSRTLTVIAHRSAMVREAP